MCKWFVLIIFYFEGIKRSFSLRRLTGFFKLKAGVWRLSTYSTFGWMRVRGRGCLLCNMVQIIDRGVYLYLEVHTSFNFNSGGFIIVNDQVLMGVEFFYFVSSNLYIIMLHQHNIVNIFYIFYMQYSGGYHLGPVVNIFSVRFF